jgi:hypothetical protein
MISEESSTVPYFGESLAGLRLLDQLVPSTYPFVLLNVNDEYGAHSMLAVCTVCKQ